MFKSRYVQFLVRTLPVFALILAACAPPVSAPTAAPLDPPVATETPTARPSAIATATATHTPTAVPPSPTATRTATATRVPPKPTATATPTPGPGDILFSSASDACMWLKIGLNWRTGARIKDFTANMDNDNLYIEIPYADSVGYAVCSLTFPGDVQIDADVQKEVGPNRNNVSLVCRMNDTGWYEASITNGGYWFLYKFTNRGYEDLAHGGSTALHLQNTMNHLTLVCSGNTISLYANHVKLGSVQDSQFASGNIAVSVTTFNIKGVGVTFSGLTVSIPDLDNPPDA